MTDNTPSTDTRTGLFAWAERWLMTIWTPIVLTIVLSPIFWIARSGNLTAGYIVTAVIEGLGATLIVTLVAKIWLDQKQPRGMSDHKARTRGSTDGRR